MYICSVLVCVLQKTCFRQKKIRHKDQICANCIFVLWGVDGTIYLFFVVYYFDRTKKWVIIISSIQIENYVTRLHFNYWVNLYFSLCYNFLDNNFSVNVCVIKLEIYLSLLRHPVSCMYYNFSTKSSITELSSYPIFK